MPSNLLAELGQKLHGADQVLLVSHIRPDGDAIGSLLGLGLSLRAAGKTVQMILVDGVPHSYRQLEGAKLITRRAKESYQVSVTLDCSDLQRTGGVLGERQPDINIDHHPTNLNFAALNLVWPEAVATSEILATILPQLNLPLDQAVASALLNGIVADTLGFRTPNVTPNTLRLAAGLMEKGANLTELYNQALVRRSYEAAQYWGLGLNPSRMQRQGRLLWTSLTLADREQISYPGNDDADLINILSTVDGSDIALIFVEQKAGKIKVSWRAVRGVDVSRIALQFGGGGHAAAAGAEISGDMSSVQARVLEATQALLKNLNGNSHE